MSRREVSTRRDVGGCLQMRPLMSLKALERLVNCWAGSADLVAEDCEMLLEISEARDSSYVGVIVVVGSAGAPGFCFSAGSGTGV